MFSIQLISFNRCSFIWS